MLHVHVQEADLVLLELAVWFAGRGCGWETIETLGLEDAVDGVAVEVGQGVGDHEGEVIEGKAGGTTQGANDGALLLAGLPGQGMRPGRAVLAVLGPALAPLADGLGGDAVAASEDAGGLVRAGDVGAHGGSGAGVGVDRVHQRALREEERCARSKRQACSSIAQRAASPQRFATKQLGWASSDQAVLLGALILYARPESNNSGELVQPVQSIRL